jgi:hypothetical protein
MVGEPVFAGKAKRVFVVLIPEEQIRDWTASTGLGVLFS